MILNIATGKSVKSTVWKNQNISWVDFAAKLSETVQTKETLKEFLQCSKEDQLAIKDVGGYVGGYLKNGRRKPENVIFRQVLTLDLDFANIDFWDDFGMFYDCAAVLHSTHKHCEENPRLRLLIPLDREASKEEYEATARKLAGDLGIDLFDNTTFEPNRLMFWPSTPKDQDYYFEQQSGEFLSVDETLATYADWTDTTLWPTSVKHTDEIKTKALKQEDPEAKRGIIGAFCRTYSIEEVIENYLSDVYKPTDTGRYTYINGSTSGGLITYENKFAYSHHGTDPIGGLLCNAFDLLRIHRFGQTEKSKKQTEDLLVKDAGVKDTLARERIDAATYDFADELKEIDKEADLKWMQDLEVDGRGKYLSTATNINAILKNDLELKNLFRLNDFDSKRYVFGSLPWRKIKKAEPMKNIDYSGIRNYIETIYGIAGNLKIDDSLAVEIEKNHFHPVRDYLSGLSWDGVQRIDNLLIEYFGATDNIYTREAIRKMLVGAVARIFVPGCKFDLVLVLVGKKEGTGKSTFVKKLGKDWFSDTFLTVHGKEALEQIQGAWIIEMAELAGLRKAEVEAIKHFITKQEDAFRPAYGRTSETYKRQCVFFGTTNNDRFLKEQHGNRRFMPVDVFESKATKDPLASTLDSELDQIWAEAVNLYKTGEKPYLSEEANAIADVARGEHAEADERTGIVESYLNKLIPLDWSGMDPFERQLFIGDEEAPGTELRQFVCIAEIWVECLQKKREEMDRYKTRDINEIMKSLKDWEAVNSTKNFGIYGKQKYYKRLKIEIL